MATVTELRARLRKPLERELATGCHDDVVVGGLERLLATVGGPFDDLRRSLAGYRQWPPERRREGLEQALAMLAEPVAAQRAEVSRSRAGTRAATPQPGPVAAPEDEAAVDELLASPLESGRIDLGAQAARKLAEVGLHRYGDLLRYPPRRWEDRRALPSFDAVSGLERATVLGVVVGRKLVATRRGGGVLRVVMEDPSGGRLTAVWFHQPWVEKQVFPGQRLIVSGRVKPRGRQIELHVEGFELDDDGPSLSTGRIVAIYPSVQGLSQAYLRRAVDRTLAAVGRLPDPLPKRLLTEEGLVSADRAYRHVHQPPGEEERQQALKRLKFDEFLLLELQVLLRNEQGPGRGFPSLADDEAAFEAALPFVLTGAQQRSLAEVRGDMASPRQMARLLMGDVGSGKTAVAAGAVWTAVRAGVQAAVMAPTELLARQHYASFVQLLWPLGVRIDLLVGSMTVREREEARARLASGVTDAAVGTQALIQDGVAFRDLGLAIIDEEHRFGVEQRRKLIRSSPDVLVMTATPIPRSLALTHYGDLEVSRLDEMPPGRTPVKTELRRASARNEVYHALWAQLRGGDQQAYVVAPLVEDSAAMEEISSATAMLEDLRGRLPDARIGLLHGRMPTAEKEEVMDAFRGGSLDVLVSTTVIEVGVDVPKATVMVIENAERFGLAQLHQLRGRVGRGDLPGRCVLLMGEASRATQQRLQVVVRHTDGFLIAEEDLRLRGPGELMGTRQSGLPDLDYGDLASDVDLIERARAVAKRMLEASPRLDAVWARRLHAELLRRQHAVAFRQTL